jgi:2-methyl-3-hydroxypyridine 5-carboxylic acid dioxygenase
MHAEIGLAAAIALRRRGWSVRVHEKEAELRAFGAGIFI